MTESKPRILFVDDEERILDTFRVGLRKKYFVETAGEASEALDKIKNEIPYAVVVSDLRMPGMDGIEFLSRVADMANDSVRIMLTGHGDLETAALAVNRGQIFRFLSKPTPLEEMDRVLAAGVKQYQLITAEKELLRGTLRGAIRLLTDILSLTSPAAFGRSERIRRYAVRTGELLNVEIPLQLELAAMLSQLGCVSLDPEIVTKINGGLKLTRDEEKEFATHPDVAKRLISHIPRLGTISMIIARQHDDYEGNPGMLLESRILKVVQDYDFLRQSGQDHDAAISMLQKQAGRYDPDVLAALTDAASLAEYKAVTLQISMISEGMILDQDIMNAEGTVLLMAKGQELTETALGHLRKSYHRGKIPETVEVLRKV